MPLATAVSFENGVRRWSDRVAPWPIWLTLAVLAGALPMIAAYATGQWSWRLATAAVASLILILAIVRDDMARGLSGVGLAILTHCGLAIGLAATDPDLADRLMPGGRDYWIQSRDWIVTGYNPEYELSTWLPAHAQLALAASALSYASLGFLTLCHGLHEVDLMNYYVGQLIAHADRPGPALVLGWHPWSVCRGLGYLFLTFEIVSISLQRLLGTCLSTRRRRLIRWTIGLGFMGLDAIIKLTLMEPTRAWLAECLLGS